MDITYGCVSIISTVDLKNIIETIISSQHLWLSQYIREAYEHKERKGHPQIAWKLQETVSIL